jgi:hypothetical protein
MRSLGNG